MRKTIFIVKWLEKSLDEKQGTIFEKSFIFDAETTLYDVWEKIRENHIDPNWITEIKMYRES